MGFVVLFLASTAGAAGTWDTNSKHYGKTIVTVPPVLYVAKVTPDGRVINVSGSKITVAHEDLTSTCHKVASVTARFVPSAAGFAPAQPNATYPAACTFGVAMASFPVGYPIGALGGGKALEIDALKKACRERTTAKVVIPHPLLTGLDVTLEYAGGGIDRLRYPAPLIGVSCEPCPAPTFPTSSVRFSADVQMTIDLNTLVTGGSPPHSFKVVPPPPGMTQQGNTLVGKVAKGEYPAKILVTDTCATGTAVVSKDFGFVALKIELSKPGPEPYQPPPQW